MLVISYFHQFCSFLNFFYIQFSFIWTLSLNKSCSSLIVSDHPLEDQKPCVEIEKLLFLLVILKTEFIVSKEVTPNNYFPS